MQKTTFVPRRTLITAEWLNQVDALLMQNQDKAINPMNYGAVGDGVTDDTDALNRAFAAVKASAIAVTGIGSLCLSPFVSPVGAIYRCNGSLNLTTIPASKFYWNGSIIKSYATGLIAFDMFGGNSQIHTDLTLFLQSTNIVKIGLAVGRCDIANYTPKQLYDRKPSPNHHFENLMIIGPASFTTYYNFSSESTSMSNPRIINTYGSATLGTTYCVVLDNYNDWDSGSFSIYAPHTVPVGKRPGTHNQNSFTNAELRGRANNIIPFWMNGPRDLLYDGYMVTGGDHAVFVGGGGYSPNGDEEQVNFGNKFYLHAESFNTNDDADIPINYYFKFDNSVRDIEINNFLHEDLRIHSLLAVYTATGTKKITFRESSISWATARNISSYAYPFDPTYRARFNYNGYFSANATILEKNVFTIDTTSGSSLVSFTLTNNSAIVGEKFGFFSNSGGALTAVNGVTLFGYYAVTNVSGTTITIETGQVASATGSGDTVPVAAKANIVLGRLLDLDSGVVSFNGTISGGEHYQLIKAPVGSYYLSGSNITRKGTQTNYGLSNTRGYVVDLTRKATDDLPSTSSTLYVTPYTLKYTGISITGTTITAGSTYKVSISSGVSGSVRGDSVSANPEFALSSDIEVSATVHTNDTVTVFLRNTSGSSYTLPTNTWTIRITK